MTVSIDRSRRQKANDLIHHSPHISLGKNEQEIMDYCLRMSESIWTGTVDGKLACMWGLIPPSLMSFQAYLWMMHTPLVEEHTFLFVRYSQLAMKEMLEEYEVIVGHVEAEQDRSIRWLRWLGAVFGEPVGKKIPFTIRK